MDKELKQLIQHATEELTHLGDAIMPFRATTGEDAYGGSVGSLTEAVMGVTGGLCRIADAIEALAESLDNSSRRATKALKESLGKENNGTSEARE